MLQKKIDLNAFQSDNQIVKSKVKPLNLHKLKASRSSASIQMKSESLGLDSSEGVALDANTWLPSCAEKYNISPDLRDYVLVPIPATITGIPNTNGDCFSTKQMLEFQPQHGMQSFKTFKGKPTHVEHVNKDYSIAKGVIFDSYLQPLKGFQGNHARLSLLLGFDRTRDPKLCDDILNHRINTYSIGVLYTAFRCSVCGHYVEQGNMRFCNHTNLKKPTHVNDYGKLVYRNCENLTGFECSSVKNPAFISAHHNPSQVMAGWGAK